MSFQELRDQINGIDRNEYDEVALAQFDRWLKRLDELEGIGVLVDSSPIQSMIKRLEGEIRDIERRLLEVRSITDLERLNLLDRRDLYREFTNSFSVDKSLESMSAEIKKSIC